VEAQHVARLALEGGKVIGEEDLLASLACFANHIKWLASPTMIGKASNSPGKIHQPGRKRGSRP
jgi:hypothetical protein